MVGDISNDTLQKVEKSATSNLLTEQPEAYETDKAVESPKNQTLPGKDDTSWKYLKCGGISMQETIHNFTVSVFIVTRVEIVCAKCIALFKKDIDSL